MEQEERKMNPHELSSTLSVMDHWFNADYGVLTATEEDSTHSVSQLYTSMSQLMGH